jgi:hypothetical protein
MFIIITRAVHIGACLILVSLFAFEMLIAIPALWQADRSALEYVQVGQCIVLTLGLRSRSGFS